MSETERASENASAEASTASSSSSTSSPRRGRRVPVWLLVTVVVVTALATAGIAALLTNMFERKQEARNPYVRLVDVDDNTTDPHPWGINWSREYDGYSRTVDTTHTRYGGSDGSPSPSRLAEDPWLKR